MPRGLTLSNKQAVEESTARFNEALAKGTLAEAIEHYGSRPSFWNRARTLGRAAEVKDMFREEMAEIRRRNASVARGTGHYQDPRDMVEDAEFLSRTGEIPINAARRLGYNSVSSMERALEREGRLDILSRLVKNDGLYWKSLLSA